MSIFKRLKKAEEILHALYVFGVWMLSTQKISDQKRKYGEACTEEAKEYIDKYKNEKS